MVAIRAIDETFLNESQLAAIDRACQRWGFDVREKAHFIDDLKSLSFEEREIVLCAADYMYFVLGYVQIYDAQSQDWIPFDLWPEQMELLDIFHLFQLVVALKARQLGISWLGLAYALWQMLFAPIATILIFSKRDDEATYLLGEERLRGMYNRLPDFLKALSILEDNVKTWQLSNGSIARAFPTTAGDSYTATLVIVDEADLVPNLNKMLRSVKPTIDAGGKMFLISRVDKTLPQSEFKAIYRAAKKGKNGWKDFFLPWWVRPERDEKWYLAMKADVLERTGSLDDLHEQYPATDAEALAPAQKNKRIPAAWVDKCYQSMRPVDVPILNEIPGLVVYKPPIKGRRYAGGADCAEGLPTSDDSATTWVDVENGEEVANLVGKYTPELHATYSAKVSRWYNDAGLMVENNSIGYAFIMWLRENSDTEDGFHYSKLVLQGHNKKDGWTSNTLGKVLMYDNLAESFRIEDTIIHDDDTMIQIKSIVQTTLRAPEGEHDDRADSYALALLGADEVIKMGSNERKYTKVKARVRR